MLQREGAMFCRILVLILSFSMLFFSLFSVCQADNADVLPKGVWRIKVDSKLYFPVDERFNDDGDTEDVAKDYNANLNSSVFPALAQFEVAPPQGFGLPEGSATIGRSVVDIEYDFYLFEFYVERGITDRLSVGIKIPYWDVKTNVDARVDSSNATVGTNPLYNRGLLPQPLDQLAFIPTNPAFLPPGVPAGSPVTTEQVQDLLGRGLDVDGNGTIDVAGFGYKRVETWAHDGFSDIEAGLKYQYLKTEDWRLAVLGAVRFPTGREDDADNLVDYAFGEGAYALLFHLNNSYAGIANMVLDLTLKYELVFPHSQEVRVPEEVNQPITGPENKEDVDIDPGDIIKIEPSLAWEFLKGCSFLLEYEYAYRFEADVSGDKGLNYESLEAESNFTEHVIKVGVSYSTIPLYAEKKFPLPLTAYALYRNRFAGENVLKSQYIGLGLAFYF